MMGEEAREHKIHHNHNPNHYPNHNNNIMYAGCVLFYAIKINGCESARAYLLELGVAVSLSSPYNYTKNRMKIDDKNMLMVD